MEASGDTMNREPEPCSTCGRRRKFGKNSSNPGGSFWSWARSTCCALMNTTAGFTGSATLTNASPRSDTVLKGGVASRGAVACAARMDSAAPLRFGRSSVGANASPNTNAVVTRPPNLIQSRCRAEPRLERRVDLVGPFLRVLLHLIHQGVEPVAALDLVAAPLVLGGVRLRVLHHLVDILLPEPGRGLDADLLLLARGLVPRGHVQDAVRVDVERDLDLRHAARSRRNPGELEFPDRPVVGRHLALALQHVDLDRGLGVLGGREDLRLLGGDRGLSLDQDRRDPAERLDPHLHRRAVEG